MQDVGYGCFYQQMETVDNMNEIRRIVRQEEYLGRFLQ